jgi:rhamnosyl/mannosyltransferase
VIVSSPNLAAESAVVRHARRVAVIPFGIPTERFRRLDTRQRELAARLRASSAGPRVLFVGRLVYYKGVQVLLEAMAKSGGTLILVGEGPLEGELRRQAAALGIASRVVFAGRVENDDLPAYYHAADLFVLPSVARTEAFGVVQLEAMAAGVPVISTNLPTGVPWVNQHGDSGLVVEPGDVDGLSRAIQRLGTDKELRARLGAAASARAESFFSRRRMVQLFRDEIERIAGVPAPSNRPELAEAGAL